MNQTSKYSYEVQKLLAGIHEPGKDELDTQPLDSGVPLNEIDVYVEADRITLIPKRIHGVKVNEKGVIDNTPAEEEDAQQAVIVERKSTQVGLVTLSFFMLLALASLVFQIGLILNPLTVTVTIMPKSEHLSVAGTLQLGRLLSPITVSLSVTTGTTGIGHQDAKQAIGSITFYNGQLNSVTIAAGTILTGTDGVQIATDQDANIPAADPTANPPIFGQVSVTAHATNPGTQGNIPAFAINQPCCLASVIAKNTQSFHGGEDERNFQTVTKRDINAAAAALNTTLTQSVQGALREQLKNGEALVTPTCIPTVTTDHQIGQEATEVKVTVSETCTAVAYTQDALKAQVRQLLTHQASKKLGTGYGLLGDVRVTVNQANVTGSHPTLAFSCTGVWVYAVSDAAQEHIKMLIAGKTKQEAMYVLLSQPGISKVSIQWADDTKLPKDPRNIHIVLISGLV